MNYARPFFALWLGLLAVSCAFWDKPKPSPGLRLVEKVDRVDDDIVIPYEKYVLDNGLTVLLHHDDSDPLVHVDVTYHVGSAREEIGKSGFAHFFEHMMFQGSENVADDQHFKIVNEAGGTLNGTTNIDRTNYYQTVPKNQLEKILWLEADRMGFLLPAVTQEKFEIQRSTVKNERAQNYENRPYGLQFERTIEALYPQGHPYSWMTIGYVEDLDRVDVDDLKAFFRRWYGPNNATLTIGGDFVRDQALRWVRKYFGPIPRGPAVEPAGKWPVTLDSDRRLSMEDKVAAPLLRITVPTVYFGHPDEVALDALSDILAKGTSSLLYRRLQSTGMAASTTGAHSCGELACALTFSLMPAEAYSLHDVRLAFERALREFAEHGASDDDLIKIKNSAKAEAIFRMQSVSGKVSYLALMETLKGSPNQIGDEIAGIEALTKADIVRVFQQYLRDKPAVYLSIVPQGELDTLKTPANWTFPGRDLPAPGSAAAEHPAGPPVADSFDRSVMPPAGPVPALQSLQSWNAELPNGISVMGVQTDEVPTTAMLMRMKVGQQHEVRDKLGVANLTAYVMNESTELCSAADLNLRLAKLSSTLRFYTDGEYAFMSIGGLTAMLDETLEIATERLTRPKFEPAEFDRWKKQALKLIALGKDYAPEVANGIVPLLLFGADNNFAYSSLGLKESVENVTLDDVRRFYDRHYSPTVAEILVISDLAQNEVMERLAGLSAWQTGAVPAAADIRPFPELHGGAIYLVDLAGAKQSEIRVASRSVTYDALGEHYRLTLLNHSLAGSFNSRINLNLREDKGYSYGAFAYLRANETTGRYVVRTSVRNDATAAAIEEIFKEIRGVHSEGITDEELVFTRRAIGQRDALAYETPNHKVHIMALTQRYGLGHDWPRQQHDILMNIGVEELNELARAHLDVDEMITVVVGDKAEILSDLETLGRPIIEIDEQGRTLPGNFFGKLRR